MRLDSEITLTAVKSCAKAGIPVLPVHDSMLTPERYAGRMAEIMEASAAQQLKTSNPCRVKISGHPVPQMPCRRSPSLSFSPPSSSGVGGCLAPASALPVQLDLFPSGPKTFSGPIRELRERLGLSQRALAEKLGCRQPHIANVECGRDRLGTWPSQRLRELIKEAA